MPEEHLQLQNYNSVGSPGVPRRMARKHGNFQPVPRNDRRFWPDASGCAFYFRLSGPVAAGRKGAALTGGPSQRAPETWRALAIQRRWTPIAPGSRNARVPDLALSPARHRRALIAFRLLGTQLFAMSRIELFFAIVTVIGFAKGNRNAFKHGRYTAEAIARRREISKLIAAMKASARQVV